MATADGADEVVNVWIPQATQHPSLARIGDATAIGIAANQLECARQVDRRVHQRLHARTITAQPTRRPNHAARRAEVVEMRLESLV